MKLCRKPRLPALLLATFAALAASAVEAGDYYESVTTERVEGQRKANETKVRAWVDGDKSRVEFQSGMNNGWLADGNYLVTTDGGENVFLVNPSDETYGRFNLEEMMATLGRTMDAMEEMGGMMKMEFTNVSSEKLLEESGGTILGHSTTHYRYKSSYTMSLKVMGLKQRSDIEMIQDVWSTDDLDARGFGVWLRPDRRLRTGNDELDTMLNEEMNKIKGFPLKMVNDMTTTNKKGKQRKSTSTTEVNVLRQESVSDDKFTWPEHYTETQIIPDLAGMNAEDDGEKKGGLFGRLKKRDGK